MSRDASLSTTQYVELRGNRFAYTQRGSGPVVISAHGLTSSRANNRIMGLSDFSEVLDAGRQLISYDARGHGESSGTRNAEDYSWADLAKDMLALADHFSPDAPVVGIGSSMGTGILLHAASQRPDRFAALILTAPPTAWETRADQAGIYRQMADLFESSEPDAVAALFAQAPVSVPPVFANVPGYPAAPDISFELLPTVFRGAGLSDLPPLALLSTLTQATLILPWAGDPGHPVVTAQELMSAMPNAQLHVTDTHEDLLTWGQRSAAFLGSHDL
ncbi:MAG: alpha/beta hydrolase [Actinomycetota bacterium]|nr:alpha/beta hydrolase [Actinomycetota bacterium]